MTNKTKNETKFYTKWWFWVILATLLLGVSGVFSEDCDCPETYEAEYLACQNQMSELQTAWDDYLDALDDYCILDYTNPLCYIFSY